MLEEFFYVTLGIMTIQALVKNQTKKNVPDLRAGQIVRVHERIREGDKDRIQVFEGLIISVKHGKGLDGMFTVRKMAAGNIGVERIFPLHLPAIEKIEVLREEKVRRAKLYYVRAQVGKKTKRRKAQLKSVIYDFAVQEEEPVSEEATPEDKAAVENDDEAQAETQNGGEKKESNTQTEETQEKAETSEETQKEDIKSSSDKGGEEESGQEK